MKHLKELAGRLAAMNDEQRAAIAAQSPVITIERHLLSHRNNCLLVWQSARPVTMVGGFRQWLKAGRCVARGESALWILAPMSRNARDTEQPDAEGKITFFREVPVFDVAQTTELPAVVA